MNIRDLNGKTVCILGAYGREGKAMTAALKQYAPDTKVTLRDRADGDDYLGGLDEFDVIIKAPGIPPSKLPEATLPITNSTQIFLDSIDPRATVIGVTGSKGKSTTASLIYTVLKAAGKKTLLLGNIGDAAIAHLGDVDEHTIVVLEMSSYQLMQLTRSPQVAVVTSFFPEHLDYHGSLEAYKDAKKQITKFQTPDDTVLYFGDNEGAKDIASLSAGTKVAYYGEDAPIAVKDTQLIGTHNLFNIAGATAVARQFGIDDETIITAVQTFKGLPHRLQDLGVHHSIRWVDDAISTTPESTIAAIHALSPRVHTLICGGQDRGNDFTELGKVIDESAIEHVITMGESGPRIAATISQKQVHTAQSIEEAVEVAKGHQSDDEPICLLSPASPSYGMYKNFEEKGQLYANAIQN